MVALATSESEIVMMQRWSEINQHQLERKDAMLKKRHEAAEARSFHCAMFILILLHIQPRLARTADCERWTYGRSEYLPPIPQRCMGTVPERP